MIHADARAWLAGDDPFVSRRNYSIAKCFADKNPGQSHPATMKRIQRKLAKNRIWTTLATAEILSHEGYPYAVYIRALEALYKLRDPYGVGAWRLDRARSDLADYEAKMGEPPPSNLSMKEVEDAARSTLLKLIAPRKSDGLGGLARLLSDCATESGNQG